jgi:hypothetical protein
VEEIRDLENEDLTLLVALILPPTDTDFPGGSTMKWVTRKRIHVDRTATGWLIRRFLDADAEILFVEPAEVAVIQDRDDAVGFDAPGARYPHKDAEILERASFLYDSLYAHLSRLAAQE